MPSDRKICDKQIRYGVKTFAVGAWDFVIKIVAYEMQFARNELGKERDTSVM